jgi:hypothetical protein
VYRRAVLAIVGGASAGCLSTVEPAGTASPSAASRRERDGLSATVTTVTYDGTAGETEERVSLSVDCDARSATLGGWFSTSSCRTVAIRSLRYDDAERRAELVLYPRWTESDSPDTVDCAGASYRYRIELEAREHLPTAADVVYERAGGGPPTRFTARDSGCS